jgi:polyhydroxyalkanoate synthesis regulator phasin
MPTPDWKQVLETGQEFTEMTRARAREIANRLVDQGHLRQNQVSSAVDEILAQSKRRSAQLRTLIDERIQAQFRMLGVATRADLDALESRLLSAQKKAAARKPVARTKAKPAGTRAKSAARSAGSSPS